MVITQQELGNYAEALELEVEESVTTCIYPRTVYYE